MSNVTSKAVSICAFNRYDYFDRCLTSLENQKDVYLDSYTFYFIQDGVNNPNSGKIYSTKKELDKLLKRFEKSSFKNKRIFQRGQNSGAAINMYETIDTPFVVGNDTVVAIQEDIVAKSDLLKKSEYFFRTRKEDVLSFCKEIPMACVGYRAKSWPKIKEKMSPFIEYCKTVDYMDRDTDYIANNFKVGTEDANRKRAISESGCTLYQTINLSKHIGSIGMHHH